MAHATCSAMERGGNVRTHCARCLYPINARPTIILDQRGVCSGCRYHESRGHPDVDWSQRRRMFEGLLEEAVRAVDQGRSRYHCVIPVSGGKDSHFQVWLLTQVYGLNPLLVHFNHGFNTPAGRRNLANLADKSRCDVIEYSMGLTAATKISRLMLERVGDVTWHYHAGIRTVPFQVAINYETPLIVWGEHGFAELTGLVSLKDFVEFTNWTRVEHDMRGVDSTEIIGQGGVTEADVSPLEFPPMERIEALDVRGIYLSNFFPWDAHDHAIKMMQEWDFGAVTWERERTFNLYSKIEDHANDVHDYLKYLKFGYGRCTDDASMSIRHGRLTRSEGIDLVGHLDDREPSTLAGYLDLLEISRDTFFSWVDPMRDPFAWERTESNSWARRNQLHVDSMEESGEYTKSDEHIFSDANRQLYFNPANPPASTGERPLDEPSPRPLAR